MKETANIASRRGFLSGVLISCGLAGLSHANAKPEKTMDSQSPDLSEVTIRYPEKTFFLGQVFNDTTNSYKLVWFLAILALIKKREENVISLNEIFEEMLVCAWHPVCLYLLSLGRQDKLQELVLEIKAQSGLAANADSAAIKRWLSDSKEFKNRLDYFRRYVPTRFLAPWFAEQLRGVRDDIERTKKTIKYAEESQATAFACPYYFNGDHITMNQSWLKFFKENMAVVQSFAEHNFGLYLQARNPNVPGIINKLNAPSARQLSAAREFWTFVRNDFTINNQAARFIDIYAERPLDESFSIDHFLPWSFVVHDLFWNLTPVEKKTNSSKNNNLPDLEFYLPKLAGLHYEAVKAAMKRPKLLEHYLDCFKQDPEGLIKLGEKGFIARYRDVMVPQAQIAINQGFQSGWRFREN